MNNDPWGFKTSFSNYIATDFRFTLDKYICDFSVKQDWLNNKI